MTDYKRRQFQDDDHQEDPPEKKGMIGDARKPYVHDYRAPESSAKVVTVLNDFYKDKAKFDAFARVVGKDEALKWMGKMFERATKK